MRPLGLGLAIVVGGCILSKGLPPAGEDPSCQIKTENEHQPGWPYDLAMFRGQVLPMIVATCATAGCHAAPSGNGAFSVWADAAPGNCSYAQTFNSLSGKTDLDNPQNSGVYVAVTGGDPLHPLKLGANDDKAKLLLAYVSNAAQTRGNSSTPPPSANPFAYDVFQSQIQPILDGAEGRGCTSANCHGAAAGIGGLHLVHAPAAGSPDMLANFQTVTQLCSLDTPEQSLFYLQATNRHASGGSAVVAPNEGQAILGWIQQAKNNRGSGGTSCPSLDGFDLGVFQDEIQPILFGTIDLNNPSSTRTTTGCSRSTCHGADRSGGALVIKQTATAQENLRNFVCFVNPTSPITSDILRCPLNDPACRHAPHPGQTVFAGSTDLNYQRVLSYLYAAKTATTPLDFAFYARQINTIFNDVTSVQGGAQNRTCADTVSCHGIAIAGQPAPNGSNFPMFANAGDKARLAFNFSSAANFTNFIDPRGSSLYLYPTDEIANLANPFATGLHHPGGLDFAVDSVQARAIVQWAHGLRPDGSGHQLNWLVAGDYVGAQITDLTFVDERAAKPSIFDPDGASQFNLGQWDGLFAQSADVNLNQAFPRAQTTGRIAYAVAYILNTSPSDIDAQVTVTSPNAIKLYVGSVPVVQTDDARAGVTGLATFSTYATGHGMTRLLLKVLQRAGDQQFMFRVRLQDQFGNPLTAATGELVVKLSPNGGI